MDPLIRLSNIHFAYPSAPAVLEGVDFALAPGERVGLVGANGSGKSTLLHLIVGLLTPTAGSIEAFGAEVSGEPDFVSVRRRVQLMFQDADDQLFCPTVAEDIAFGPINLGHSPDQAHVIVHQTLDVVGLSDYSDRITYKLSTGEKRLVALATVLAMTPDVLLLDEPSANLDAAARARLIEILLSRHEAMVVVSHDREMLRRLCDRVIVLADGAARCAHGGDRSSSQTRTVGRENR